MASNELDEMLTETILDCDRAEGSSQHHDMDIVVSSCEEENDLFWKCALRQKIA